MYQLQETPDKKAELKNGAKVIPLATLKDQHGGIAHIIEDDHCFVLILGSEDRKFNMVSHWFPEVVKAIYKLEPPKYVAV